MDAPCSQNDIETLRLMACLERLDDPKTDARVVTSCRAVLEGVDANVHVGDAELTWPGSFLCAVCIVCCAWLGRAWVRTW